MKVIGLTGGIGCGKSFVANVASHFLPVLHISTDELARRQMMKGGKSYEGVVMEFSPLTDKLLLPDGEINRPELSRIVFSDEKQIGVCVLTNMNVAASTDSLCNGIYATYVGQRFDKIQTDVWTVFDYIFTAVTIMGVFFVIMSFTIKHRGVLIGSEIFLVLLLVTVCIVMPLVFGAGLDKIMIIWAPNSFAGGLIMLAAGVISIAAKLWMVRKNEN